MRTEQGAKSYERVEYISTSNDTATQRYESLPPSPHFSTERIVKFAVLFVLLILCGLVLWYYSRFVLYLISGTVIAYLISPLVERIERVGLRRVPAILITFAILLGTITIIVTSLVPFIVSQLSEITQQITVEKVVEWADALETELRNFAPAVQEGSVRDAVQNVTTLLFQEQRFGQFVESAFVVFTDIFYALLIIPFVTFFVLRDASTLRRQALTLVPNRYFEVTLSVIEKIKSTLGRYLRGLVLQSTCVAAIATFCLSFTNINYVILVGIFTGIANTIPYFGPVMGLTAGSLIAIAQTGDLTLIPGVLIAMGITQTADNLFFQPLIFSKSSQTHPLIIVFVVLIGAQQGGIIGMLVAIPLMTIIWVTIRHISWSISNYRILSAG